MAAQAATRHSQAAANGPAGYQRRQPKTTLLHQTVQAHGLQLLADLEAEGDELPAFVRAEFQAHLRCGILAHGFVRVRCKDCGDSRAVAFSCKRRGGCPNCMGRRMADTAAFCIDHLVPRVPVRQFVLTAPMRLRFRMASSPPLTSAILRCFIAAVTSDLRRRARRLGFCGNLQTGAMTVVQRFGSSLALNVHFHTLAVDGVWSTRVDGRLDFHPLPAPCDHDVARIARAVYRKVQRMTARGTEDDEQPSLLGNLANSSVQDLVATGPRRGWRVLRLGATGGAAQAQIPTKRCAEVAGFNVHANTSARASDRKRLEVLIKYLTRSPIAHDRLSKLPDGRLALQFKQPWRDGSTHVVFTPQELIEKLIPLIPRPRAHVIRYHGILGPAAKDRHKIVPGLAPVQHGRETVQPRQHQIDASPKWNRLPWAVLLKRVFLVDVLECPKCKGRMVILAVVTKRASVRRYLEGTGLPSEVPRSHVARPPPRPDFW